jgi:hydrogenase nickel incorporation protein HypA/HybF
MHELSVATALLNTALKHAEERPVSVVAVRVGALRQVVPESLRFYFEIVARDTGCEAAALEIEEIALELACGDCDRHWSPQIPAFRCPDCGSVTVDALAGEELEVDYIEVEDREAVCTAPE